MSHPTSDDPFAELFGRLPDPRSRELPTLAQTPAEPTASHTDATQASGPIPTTGPDGAPLSRRAAREAAARAATQTADSAAESRDDAAGDAAPGAASLGAGADGLLSTPRRPAAAAVSTEDIDPAEAWVLAGAGRSGPTGLAGQTGAAAPGYLRTGGNAVVPSDAAPAVATRREERHPSSAASLEDLFSGSHTTDDIGHAPPPPDKRKRRIGGWIALGVVLVILGGIAGGGWYVWTTYEDKIREVMGWEEPKDYEAGLANGEALVTISSGDNPSDISLSLAEAGVTKTPDAFYDMLIDEGVNPTFYPGVYRLQLQMTSAAALAALQDPANKLENSALIREGLTVEQTLPILAEGLGLPLEDFQAAVANPAVYGVAADNLEGWLFPAMYTFDPGVTATDVIATLVSRTVQSLDQAGVPEADRQQILTIASIIQREARYEEDMAKVSRVIQNRLDPGNQETFGLLQMDSTAQYGYGEMHDGTASSSAEALEDDNPWNTYVHQGLPIGPISNPGDTAINAAMHPADGEWLYFVTVNLDTGETVFTTNLADHNRAVSQWVSWCADHPDSGC